MSKIIILFVLLASFLLIVACGAPDKVANAPTNTNATVVPATTLDPANMPPGLSGKEITPPANVPGIPNEVKPLGKGATSTPGIPSEAELKKPFKPGLTPTPGIPDPETIRKAMGQPSTNVNMPPPSGVNPPPTMMKSNKARGGKIQ